MGLSELHSFCNVPCIWTQFSLLPIRSAIFRGVFWRIVPTLWKGGDFFMFSMVCMCLKTSLVLSIALCAKRILLYMVLLCGGCNICSSEVLSLYPCPPHTKRQRECLHRACFNHRGLSARHNTGPAFFKPWSKATVSVRALKTLSPPGIEPGAGVLVASITNHCANWLTVLHVVVFSFKNQVTTPTAKTCAVCTRE